MSAQPGSALTPRSWLGIIASAFMLFDDAEERGFGTPPFSLGGGTVLMLRFRHRLSKDIDFFGYDAQWLSVLSPRLSEASARLVTDYAEQANAIKLVMAHGDIDFIVAGDVSRPVDRTVATIAGRDVEVDPTSEILAKKLFYRAAGFKPRDVYDLSSALDLAPDEAAKAVDAALPQADILLRRLAELDGNAPAALLAEIVPYGGRLDHAHGMLDKVRAFVLTRKRLAAEGGLPAPRPGAGSARQRRETFTP